MPPGRLKGSELNMDLGSKTLTPSQLRRKLQARSNISSGDCGCSSRRPDPGVEEYDAD